MLDGEIVAAAEEERFRRIKHWAGFPAEAIQYCLAEIFPVKRSLRQKAIAIVCSSPDLVDTGLKRLGALPVRG